MSDDLVSKRRAERCTTHSHACDCREYAHAKYTADLLAEIERLRVVGADLQAARERAYDNRDMALQAVEEVERERDLWKSQVHDEIAANLAFRAAGGALQDEDMPTFCARIIAERDALRARIEALVIERDHAQASLEHVIRHLGAIHMVMKPDAIRLPDGRIFEFNNPSIEREMLGALCDYIRSIPTVFDEARQARRPGGGQ